MGISIRRRADQRGEEEYGSFRLWVSLVLGLVGLIVAGGLVAGSPLFHLRRTQVTGTGRLSERQILRAAGLNSGTNVLFLSTTEVRDRLLADPWVADASVEKTLPSSIVVRIRERAPVAAIREVGGFALVASDGTTLAETGKEPSLPQIVGFTPAEPGRRSDVVAPLAAVAGAMDESLRGEVTVIALDSDGMVKLELHRGPRVRFGSPTDAEAKAESLAGILRWANSSQTRLSEIDVRAPDAPAAKSERRRR